MEIVFFFRAGSLLPSLSLTFWRFSFLTLVTGACLSLAHLPLTRAGDFARANYCVACNGPWTTWWQRMDLETIN